MSVRLKKAERVERELAIVYSVSHSNEKTTLDLDLVLRVDSEGVRASMVIDGPETSTPDEALDRLADWLERCAAALRDRDRSGVRIPV